MKAVKIILRILAFACTYIVPVLLLGVISPLVSGELGTTETTKTGGIGLTGMGYIALAIAVVIVAFKLLTKVLKMKKGWVRALIISAYPIGIWLLVFLGIDYVRAIMLSISQYWIKVGIFIFIGRTLAIVEECLSETPTEKKVEETTENEVKK
jgi:hypothetical protein